ncbi:MAG: hypothetical protein ACI841_002110 [Planctomycetota bacterium]|jgi:hypothetical protein
MTIKGPGYAEKYSSIMAAKMTTPLTCIPAKHRVRTAGDFAGNPASCRCRFRGAIPVLAIVMARPVRHLSIPRWQIPHHIFYSLVALAAVPLV